MDREQFEELVAAGIQRIPKEFLDKIENVAIIVEDEPTASQREKLGLPAGVDLFGLYEGVSLLKRGGNYTAVPPDRITIFQKPIERAAGSSEEIEKMVKDTVWHEIAHYFGMSEEEVERIERERKD